MFSAADRLEPRRRHLREDARTAVTDRPPQGAGRRVARRFNSGVVVLVDWRFSRLEHPAETSAETPPPPSLLLLPLPVSVLYTPSLPP